MSLLDKLRSQLGNAKPEQITDETARAEELQRGLTGRAVASGSSPQQSRLSERIARQQVQAATEDQAQKEQVQSEQLALAEESQEQAFTDQQLGQIEQAMGVKQRIAQQTESLLNELERGNKQLDLQKDAAKLEQVGFNLRMNNKRYIDALTQASQQSRLDQEISFNEELTRAVFEDEIELLNSDLAFQRMIDADNRALLEDLSNISLDQAIAIANAQFAQQSKTSMFQGISGAISGGAQMYQTWKTSSEEEEG